MRASEPASFVPVSSTAVIALSEISKVEMRHESWFPSEPRHELNGLSVAPIDRRTFLTFWCRAALLRHWTLLVVVMGFVSCILAVCCESPRPMCRFGHEHDASLSSRWAIDSVGRAADGDPIPDPCSGCSNVKHPVYISFIDIYVCFVARCRQEIVVSPCSSKVLSLRGNMFDETLEYFHRP